MSVETTGGRDAGRGRRPSGEGRDGHKWTQDADATCVRCVPRHSTALRAVTPAASRLLRFCLRCLRCSVCELCCLRHLPRAYRPDFSGKLVTHY